MKPLNILLLTSAIFSTAAWAETSDSLNPSGWLRVEKGNIASIGEEKIVLADQVPVYSCDGKLIGEGAAYLPKFQLVEYQLQKQNSGPIPMITWVKLVCY